MSNGPKLSETMWTTITSKIASILEKNSPQQVLVAIEQSSHLTRPSDLDPFLKKSSSSEVNVSAPVTPGSSISDPETPALTASELELKRSRARAPQSSGLKVIMGKCTVQLAILGAINEILFTHYSSLTTAQLITLLDALNICYKIGDSDLLQIKPHPTGFSSYISN